MKTLFLAVTAKLQEMNTFSLIDMDKGQLDAPRERPAVAFPCALVKCAFPSFDEYGGGLKNRIASVRVRIAFDTAAARTSTLVPGDAREQSLNYIDTAEAVFEALRRFAPEEYTAFETREFVQEDRSDGVVVMRLSYSTNRIDV